MAPHHSFEPQLMELVEWPQSAIPVEIFAIIVSFLSRSNVQNMRLVNKEFEDKVSQYLFKTVVVPFKPEIYGIAEEPGLEMREVNENEHQNLQSNIAVMLQDKGMRVFQGFGRHIHKFAMSFEFDYDILTQPPIKSDQEAITTFWGIYRWPYKGYHRYETLEGLEQTADETRTMAKALRFIKNAKELGLSIDGGLGWLAGPDINSKVHNMTAKIAVFGASTFPAEETRKANIAKSKVTRSVTTSLSLDSLEDQSSGNQVSDVVNDEVGHSSAWFQMLREAGYEGQHLAQSVMTLRESEGVSRVIPSGLSLDSTLDGERIQGSPLGSDITDIFMQRIGYEEAILERMRLLLNSQRAERRLMEIDRPQGDQTITSSTSTEVPGNLYPLKPNDLTNAQKEMLLETEWAQRAFMQSYAIAVIDNPLTFQTVETLTIARLPSRHLSILRRADFWSSLSNLKTLSLAVIPDWRDIIKLPTSWVEDVRVQPSQAIRGVHQLLRDHVATNRSITTLRFEWLCGGEESAGVFARNQHVLAAPLLPQAINMISPNNHSSGAELLNMPYVQHLTLKNCWITPHILVKFSTSMRIQSLQSLTFDSVSLTAPAGTDFHLNAVNAPPNVAPQPPHPQNLNNLHVQGLQHAGGQVPAILMAPIQSQVQLNMISQPVVNHSSWLDPPRNGSWAEIIEHISPGVTLAGLRFSGGIIEEPPTRKPTNLNIINFHSCGYVRLPLDFDQTVLDPPERRQGIESSAVVSKRRFDLEPHMMQSNDRMLGTIVNYISEEEIKTLEYAWNLSMGWGDTGKVLAAQAFLDGVNNAGQGRFRGSIMKNEA